MKCPIRNQQYKGAYGQDQYEDEDCLKDECAWWHPTTQSCEVSRIAGNLSGINNALISILEKMPFKREV